MSNNRDAIKEIINKAWESGKAKGLTDEEIIAIIEDTLKQRVMEKQEFGRRKKKYNYTPMTDAEIQASQEKIGTSTQVTEQVYVAPQVLYGPPPMEKVEMQYVEMPQVLYGPPPMEKVEVHYVEMPQVLYGPPPKEELHEMFVDESDKKGGKGNPHRK